MSLSTSQEARRRRRNSLTPQQERAQRLSALLLRAIEQELPGQPQFTREDLLNFRVFSHVATITRYALVCQMVNILAEQGKLKATSRTILALPGQKIEPLNLHQYQPTILALAKRWSKGMGNGDAFGVMDLVSIWRTDPQLTTNNKRVAVRQALPRLVRQGEILPQGDLLYRLPGEGEL